MQIITSENVILPTGDYLAEVTDISHETGTFGTSFKWMFEVLKPNSYTGKMLVGWTSDSPSLKGKFVKWASACIGRPIGPGEPIDTGNLIGTKVMLVVISKTGDDGGTFNRVEDLRAHHHTSTPSGSMSLDEFEDPFANG